MKVVTQIIVSHKPKIEKLKVKSVVENITKEHTPKGHHFKVAWALWLCKEFEIKLPNTIADLKLVQLFFNLKNQLTKPSANSKESTPQQAI